MTTVLRTILSAAGVVALLASPAMAKTARQHHAVSPYYPSDARGYVAPYGTFEGGPYTPSVPSPAYGRDFQDGSRG